MVKLELHLDKEYQKTNEKYESNFHIRVKQLRNLLETIEQITQQDDFLQIQASSRDFGICFDSDLQSKITKIEKAKEEE